MKLRAIIFCWVQVIILLLSCGQTAVAQVPASKPEVGRALVPRFESSACALPVPPHEKHVECGYLIVPENRAAKNQKTIRLPIVILKTDSTNPKPDPVLKTLGGPGGSSLKMIRGRNASPWLKDRDYIIYEQRGTRYSQPALECPEVNEANISSAKNKLDRRTARINEVAAAKMCFDRLRAAGIDLDAYNSRESAADIEDLRRVLHIEKINLYGVSYSARLMLDVMRYHPSGIRSVVLESTLPPEVNYDEVGVDGIVRALNEMFAGCRRDADCTAAFPDLEKEFYAVVSRLNGEPLIVSTPDPASAKKFDIKLDGNDFLEWIIDYLFSNEPAATVDAPYVIHEAFGGHYVDQFKRYAGDKLGGSGNSWGMRYSVWCSEEIPFESRTLITGQSAKYAGLRGYEVMALPDICRVWKVKPAKPEANRPVVSSIPALVLAAQYDAYTAPEWGQKVAGRLKNSFFFEVPWAGHGPAFSVPCVSVMIAAFIDDPAKPPDTKCLDTTKRAFRFITKPQPH
jgi:pimeloyl-ACP methyl ester carboxylesterase